MKNLDQRSQTILKILIEHYIAQGQPIGSQAISHYSKLKLSPATIRNIMGDLEDLGLLMSPHTSSGRIPTSKGYRFFVDSLLSVRSVDYEKIPTMSTQITNVPSKHKLLKKVSKKLSDLTHFASIVLTSQTQASRVKQLDFVPLSQNRILLIIVTSTGEVQNRILISTQAYNHDDLIEASNYFSNEFSGFTFDEIKLHLQRDLNGVRAGIAELMNSAVEAGSQMSQENSHYFAIAGEGNLLAIDDLTRDLNKLRELFHLFEKKTHLLQLLDISSHAQGVQIFIGGESGISELSNLSYVTAPYVEKDGTVIGSVGVIGPTRMAYGKIIPIVDITARILSNTFAQQE